MHFHLPKPLHGWREFAGEVGIIVIGVLIALGAEQTVEALHNRMLVHEMIGKLRAESLENRGAIKFSLAGLDLSLAQIDRDLTELGGCDRSIDARKLEPLKRQAFLVPVNAAWLGARDSALLPLMPAEVVDSHWKIDALGSSTAPMLNEVDNTFDDAGAALDTLRGGVNDRQSCVQAAYQLRRLKSAQRSLAHQAELYEDVNEQVLRGGGLGFATTKTIFRPSAQGSE